MPELVERFLAADYIRDPSSMGLFDPKVFESQYIKEGEIIVHDRHSIYMHRYDIAKLLHPHDIWKQLEYILRVAQQYALYKLDDVLRRMVVEIDNLADEFEVDVELLKVDARARASVKFYDAAGELILDYGTVSP